MKIKTFFLFFILFLVSFIVRFVNIDKFPSSLNWDEVSIGYNSYSILKTGKDEWGNFLPLIFKCYGDYKLPVYLYLSVPFIAFFGLNALSVKFVSILAGSLVPIFVFLIIKKLFKKNNLLPLLGSLIISLSPAFIFLSRISLEGNLFLLFFIISFYFLFQEKFSLSSIFYGLCLFTYNSSRVLLPFYLMFLCFLIIKTKYNFKKHILGFIFFFITIIVFIGQSLGQSGQARYKWVSIIDSGAINKINELQGKYPRVLINKVTYFTFSAAKNYIAHFNPNFVFFNGGSNYQFNIPNFYLISPLFLPLFIIGLISIFLSLKYKIDYKNLIVLFWLFITPIPSSITRDAPHTLRSIAFLPAIITVVVYGINRILSTKKWNIVIIYVILALLVSQISFWKKYSLYSVKFSQSWQFGYKQIAEFIQENYQKYNTIFLTKRYGEPHEFILFYNKINPLKYQSDIKKDWNYHADWYWIDGFDKYRFLNDWEVKEKTKNLTKGDLLITSPGNYNQNDEIKKIKTIYFPDRNAAFDIIETL